jgi:DNA-binding transcriptional regulator LsrR (DeoR family)
MRFKQSEVKTLWRFIRLVAGYGEVFGEDKRKAGARPAPLVNRLDAILTSVGVVHARRRGIFLNERVDLGDISEQDLTGLVVGDIGGIIIPRRDLTPLQARRIRMMNDRWTGIKQQHLEQCAQDSLRSGKPGVILLASTKSRAEMVQRCVELGLANELIIDQELADELKGLRFPFHPTDA